MGNNDKISIPIPLHEQDYAHLYLKKKNHKEVEKELLAGRLSCLHYV